jgi:hypothetical protein
MAPATISSFTGGTELSVKACQFGCNLTDLEMEIQNAVTMAYAAVPVRELTTPLLLNPKAQLGSSPA